MISKKEVQQQRMNRARLQNTAISTTQLVADRTESFKQYFMLKFLAKQLINPSEAVSKYRSHSVFKYQIPQQTQYFNRGFRESQLFSKDDIPVVTSPAEQVMCRFATRSRSVAIQRAPLLTVSQPLRQVKAKRQLMIEVPAAPKPAPQRLVKFDSMVSDEQLQLQLPNISEVSARGRDFELSASLDFDSLSTGQQLGHLSSRNVEEVADAVFLDIDRREEVVEQILYKLYTGQGDFFNF